MVDDNSQPKVQLAEDSPASLSPLDESSILLKVIETASQDPAQLRRLGYAMAWHKLRPDLVLGKPLPIDLALAKTLGDLQRVLDLRRLIERVETEIAQREGDKPLRQQSELRRTLERREMDAAQRFNAIWPVMPEPPVAQPALQTASPSETISALERMLKLEPVTEHLDPAGVERALAKIQVMKRASGPGAEPESDATQEPETTCVQPAPPSEIPAPLQDTSLPQDHQNDDWQVVSQQPAAALNQPVAWASEESVPQQPTSHRALIVVPDRAPDWLQPSPSWHAPPIRAAAELSYQDRRSGAQWPIAPLAFVQLIAAAVLGGLIFVGIGRWVQPERHATANQTIRNASPPSALSATAASGLGSFRPSLITPDADLRFALPKTYGVYVEDNGQLTELEPLPIRIPDHRIQLSAEIATPSRVTVASNKLAFVVFRRDLVNNAPQSVSVRVVARVARAMRFVDGKPITSPIEGAWRIRSKAYEFKVAPLQGHPEMIVIQADPEFAFPAGRYALVLGGYGYDFNIAGPITAPEQCLEQAIVVNGTVLSECAKT